MTTAITKEADALSVPLRVELPVDTEVSIKSKHNVFSAERKMPVEQKIRDYIVGNFLFGKDENKLQSSSSFLDMGIIDSTGVLEIILFIEEQFGIKIDDSEMLPENLDSIDNIARFVSSRNAQ